MKQPPWFRVWAAESLTSDDIGVLTHLEEVVWWRLLCVASLEEPRWTVRVTDHLARQCKCTPNQLKRALQRLAAGEMVSLHGGMVTVINGERYNPPRRPSEAPDMQAERQRKSREKRRDMRVSHDDVTRDTQPKNGRDIVVTSRTRATEVEVEVEIDPPDDSLRSSSSPEGGAADADLPVDVRERRDVLLMRLPKKFQDDWLCRDECEQLAREYDNTALVGAQVACRRENKLPLPGNLREHLPPLEGTHGGPANGRGRGGRNQPPNGRDGGTGEADAAIWAALRERDAKRAAADSAEAGTGRAPVPDAD